MDWLMDFLIATGFVLLFLLLSWVYGRLLSGGGPLNAVKRRMLIYAVVFVAGVMYIMLAVSDLKWPKELLFPMIGGWAAVIGMVAWLRHRKQKQHGMRTTCL
jgi:peptidoglycan/LPS O-acetylase OafA/YrhL